ncbi:hypothetical protein BH11PLA2_BH11PLA2_34200 [soil metagenome]
MMLAIVLVDYNGLDDTCKCLESLTHLTTPATIIVVDNASTVNVSDALATTFPHVLFIRSPVNGGWAGGNNLGLKLALDRGADLVVLLNNDTTVVPEFAARLQIAAETHPEFGILGPVIRFMEPPHEVQTEGVRFNTPQQPGFFQRVAVSLQFGNVVPVDIVNGCCLMVRRAVVEKIGFVDEEFFLIHEESDFCLRAQAAGFQLCVLAEPLVFHKGSSSFAREGKRFQRYYDARNLLRLLRKHGRRPGGRSRLSGRIHAWRYAFSRYAIERENGFRESADAVLEGLYDGVTRRYGAWQKRNRFAFGLFRRAIAGLWRVKSLLRSS